MTCLQMSIQCLAGIKKQLKCLRRCDIQERLPILYNLTFEGAYAKISAVYKRHSEVLSLSF